MTFLLELSFYCNQGLKYLKYINKQAAILISYKIARRLLSSLTPIRKQVLKVSLNF